MINTIHHGDVCDVLRRLPAASVHTCVTSPPYWGLRDYNLPPTDWPAVTFTPAAGLPELTIPAMSCCLGLEPEPWAFVGHMVAVFREVKRVLRDDGTVWCNLGDSYATSGGNRKGNGKISMQSQGISLGGVGVAYLADKNLIGIPWMCAKALQADGWWLRSDIIWSKPNPMPESVTDRPTKAHEYVFLLAKSGMPQFWTHRDRPGVRSKPAPDLRWVHADGHELTEPPDDPDWKRQRVTCPECSGAGYVSRNYDSGGMFGGQSFRVECERCGGSIEQGRKGKGKVKAWEKVNLWQGHDYYYDAEAVREAFKESGIKRQLNGRNNSWGGTRLADPRDKRGSGPRYGADALDLTRGRNRRTVWEIATESYKGAHFATFPQALVEPCILAGSSARGCCSACGAPWARVVEREPIITAKPSNNLKLQSPGVFERGGNQATYGQVGSVYTTTTGWWPTCACDAGAPVPALVLDPFFGSGTTGQVAIETGRAYVGIELSEEYITLARKRLAGAQPALLAKGLEGQ